MATSPRLLGLAKSIEVQTGGGTPKSRSEMTYDYTGYSSNTIGGNLLTTKTWDSFKGGSAQSYSSPLTSTNSITTSATYNSYGMPLTTTDANDIDTEITYGTINGYADLYPTQTTVAAGTSVARTTTAAYDFYTGVVTSTTDEDNDVTASTEYDDLGRPTKAITADGSALENWTQTEYHDADRYVVVRSDLETVGDGKKVAIQHYDQLGRVRLARTLENAETEDPDDETDGIKVQTRYKTTSGYSYQLTSNPYRAATSSAETDTTMGWTRSKAWATGHQSQVETFAGASLPAPWGSNSSSTGVVDTQLDANATTVTDQASKLRRSITNGLGQLVRVDEPTTSGLGTVSSPNQDTGYTYDVLNNLLTVVQGSQTRTFTYSSISRLRTAANPESGTITYAYDSNGNLTSKIDARSITTNYTYDALNRVTVRSYSTPNPTPSPSQYQNSPTVNYYYDNVTHAKGKLTKVTSSVSTTEYTSFDILGRVTGHKQTTDGTNHTTGYTYNLAGALTEETYPSGRVVKNVLDNTGDLSIVQSKKNSTAGYWNYADAFTYNAAGAVTSMQLGNGKWESTSFNERLQPVQIGLGITPGASNLLKLDYSYGDWNGSSIDATKNNGNIVQQVITVPNSPGNSDAFNATQKYYYDSLNRIDDSTETVSSQTWRQDFTFDRYGNRNFNRTNTTVPASFSNPAVTDPTISTTNNRITSSGWTYDAAGNTLTDPNGQSYVYDGENKQVKASNGGGTLGEYFYDGDGKRVKKVVPSTGEVTIFVYDAACKQIAEYSTIVESVEDAKVAYLTADHLGSPRINTDRDGKVTARHDYHPYGEEIITAQRTSHAEYTPDSVRKQFTGYERDNESDLDFAEARYFNSGHGRFTSVDPLLESAEPSLPQTWNRYVYCLNNPLNLVDPDGQKWEFAGNDKVKAEELKKAFEAAVKAQGEKAWKAYQAIEKAKGTIKVGFGNLGETQFGKTNVSVSFSPKDRSLTSVSGSITIGTNAKALDISNFTDLSTASGHEYSHVLTTLANNRIKGLSDLAPADGLTGRERRAGKDSFPLEEAAFDSQVKAKNAAAAGGNKPLSPDTALQRSTNAVENAKSREEKYDLIKSYGYDLKQPRPGAQPAAQPNRRVTRKP